MRRNLLGSAVVALLVLGGTAAGEEGTPIEALGLPEAVATLDAACASSPTMKAMFDATEGDGTLARSEICACVVEVLGPQLTIADAGMLARELQGTLTPDEREAYANTKRLGELAESGFSECQARTGHFTTD